MGAHYCKRNSTKSLIRDSYVSSECLYVLQYITICIKKTCAESSYSQHKFSPNFLAQRQESLARRIVCAHFEISLHEESDTARAKKQRPFTAESSWTRSGRSRRDSKRSLLLLTELNINLWQVTARRSFGTTLKPVGDSAAKPAALPPPARSAHRKTNILLSI